MPRPAPKVHLELCNGCGTCVRICPAKALSLDRSDRAQVDGRSCYRCMACVEACPQAAIYQG